MQIFYSQDILGNAVRLSEEEAKHCFRVLRHKTGDLIHITDGKGNLYQCRIEDHNLAHPRIHILKTLTPANQRPYYLELIVAPTKNAERMEWMVEKLVETGIDSIRFVKTQRTEKGSLKMERLHNKAVSAMKQSLHFTLPQILPMTDFGDLIQEDINAVKLIAWCDDQQDKKQLQSLDLYSRYRILIGPEGDFTQQEITHAINHGYQPISLGPSRFRTETAALAACMTLYLKFTL